jgi:hypothetical protein
MAWLKEKVITRRSVVTLIAFLSFSLPSFCQQIQALDLSLTHVVILITIASELDHHGTADTRVN